ncbi:MAG: MBL fold metallo-hydrolase, partial [Deltaproteobacteria bacterium]|nr:MBL fold metallo-hydrolase [Deltaproteobacteria bacterium]
MESKMKLCGIAILVVFVTVGVCLWGQYDGRAGIGIELISKAEAAGGTVTNPVGTAPDRYVYYPGTEELKKDEIRLIACGTGLPAARRDQQATCFLAEVGNGDKFLFDIGTGSMVNVAALMIPYDFLDKVFLTHLHTDH